MTRYKALRKLVKVDPITAAFIAFFNWLFAVPENEIRFMHIIIEFDPKEQS